jgi:broad specificity phosphatase PhoE
MAKPKRIILVRHGESEANVNKEILRLVPDHKVGLTPLGFKQSLDAGRYIGEKLVGYGKIRAYYSPYRYKYILTYVLQKATKLNGYIQHHVLSQILPLLSWCYHLCDITI